MPALTAAAGIRCGRPLPSLPGAAFACGACIRMRHAAGRRRRPGQGAGGPWSRALGVARSAREQPGESSPAVRACLSVCRCYRREQLYLQIAIPVPIPLITALTSMPEVRVSYLPIAIPIPIPIPILIPIPIPLTTALTRMPEVRASWRSKGIQGDAVPRRTAPTVLVERPRGALRLAFAMARAASTASLLFIGGLLGAIKPHV